MSPFVIAPKLLDFGLARETKDADTWGGTRRYLSPEVLSGLPAEEADDVWSLCVVLHEMVAGAHPFVGGGVAEVAAVFGAGASAAMSGRRRPSSRLRPWSRSRCRC